MICALLLLITTIDRTMLTDRHIFPLVIALSAVGLILYLSPNPMIILGILFALMCLYMLNSTQIVILRKAEVYPAPSVDTSASEYESEQSDEEEDDDDDENTKQSRTTHRKKKSKPRPEKSEEEAEKET